MFEIDIIERTNKDDEEACQVVYAESEAFMLVSNVPTATAQGLYSA